MVGQTHHHSSHKRSYQLILVETDQEDSPLKFKHEQCKVRGRSDSLSLMVISCLLAIVNSRMLQSFPLTPLTQVHPLGGLHTRFLPHGGQMTRNINIKTRIVMVFSAVQHS